MKNDLRTWNNNHLKNHKRNVSDPETDPMRFAD